MKLKANTFYRTKDGRKAYVAGPDPLHKGFWFGTIQTVAKDGSFPGSWHEDGGACAHMLVAEWVEPKFKVGDWIWLPLECLDVTKGQVVKVWDTGKVDIAWCTGGTSSRLQDCLELAPPPKARVRGWLNMYPAGENWFYATKEIADKKAGTSRIACVYIDFEEGVGL